MRPPIKNHTDIGVNDETIDASDGAEREDGTINEDKARQEFAKEADVNYMLSKFGVTPQRGAPTYGEWNDTIDLQMAIESTREARNAFTKLPKELREKFGSMEQFLKAVENGSLKIEDVEEEPKGGKTSPPSGDGNPA